VKHFPTGREKVGRGRYFTIATLYEKNKRRGTPRKKENIMQDWFDGTSLRPLKTQEGVVKNAPLLIQRCLYTAMQKNCCTSSKYTEGNL